MGSRLKRIWEELRRRRVMRTAAAYLAVAFVLLQLGEILFPAFDLGPAALRALFAMLIAFFPIVMAMSWVYDVTSHGLERTDAGVPGSGTHPALIGGVVMSALLLAWGGWYAVRNVDVGVSMGVEESSIAILPFTDMSETRDQSYLGDGLAEEILNVLAGIPGLKVAARTSSFAFRENDDVRDIAQRLGVTTVLEGSVRRSDAVVRVTAQLIDAETGFHLWSATYDREVDDLFLLQDEIATEIAEALLGELDLAEQTGPRHVGSPAAQEAYWRGRAQWSRRDATGIPEAIELFNRAIEEDSLYAPAYAGLADSWSLLPQLVPGVDGSEALDRAEALARRAIGLDSELAEPHASLGLVLAFRGDRVGALLELGQAIALNPSYASALHWRANVLAEMGRLAEAVEDARRARALDPLSAPIATDYGNVLLWSGNVAAARREFEAAQAIDFGYAPAAFGVALVALVEEQLVPLQMALAQWAALSGVPVTLASQLTQPMLAYRQTGVGQSVPSSLPLLGRSGQVSSGTVAAIHGLLGDRAGTLEWLRTAVEDRSWVDQYPRVNPAYDVVRDDPEFLAILQAIGD